mmetsp:Transcript_15223/g.65192  ORF Transcript_15223/g.65192 Transcript_15223/m.65192 type:complete len:300 (-) Transcript_15223:468-1367(-)
MRALHFVSASLAASLARACAIGPSKTSFLLMRYRTATASSSVRPPSRSARSSLSVVGNARSSSKHLPSTKGRQSGTPNKRATSIISGSMPSRVSIMRRRAAVDEMDLPMSVSVEPLEMETSSGAFVSINPSRDAHASISAASAKSAAASFGLRFGTNPKYRKNGSFGHGPYEIVISDPSSTPSSHARSWKKRSDLSIFSRCSASAISNVAAAPWHASGDVTTRTCAVGFSKQWLHMSTPGTARCVPLGPCVKHRLCSAPAAHRRSSASQPTKASRLRNAAAASKCAARTSFASPIATGS